MARDFRTNQIQVNKVIASGSTGTGAKILFYSIEADDSGTPNQGNIDTGVFDTSVVGNDAFMYVSGGIGTIGTDTPGAAVFGGDVYVSGNFDVAGAIFDASASNIYNDSTVAGDKVDDALDRLDLKVTASSAVVDQRIARWSGTSGVDLDSSAISIDDAGNMSLINELTASVVKVEDYLLLSQSAAGPTVTPDHATLYVKDDNGTGGSSPNLFYKNADGIELRLTRGSKITVKSNTTPATNSIPKYTNTSGELIEATNILVDDSDNMSGINELTASAIVASGLQVTGSTELTAAAGIVAIDAAVSPNYHLVLSTSVTFDNPTNAIVGQELVIGIHQDTTGNFTTAFSSSWRAVGQIEDVALSASSDSVLTAVARDYGDGLIWDYAISHAETLTGLTDLDATTDTTNATFKTIATFPTSGSNTVGLADYSIVAMSPVSGSKAQWAMRGLYSKTGSTVTPVNDNVYSYYKTPGASTWNITSSISAENINIRVQGGAGDEVKWKLKGIFKEHS